MTTHEIPALITVLTDLEREEQVEEALTGIQDPCATPEAELSGVILQYELKLRQVEAERDEAKETLETAKQYWAEMTKGLEELQETNSTAAFVKAEQRLAKLLKT